MSYKSLLEWNLPFFVRYSCWTDCRLLNRYSTIYFCVWQRLRSALWNTPAVPNHHHFGKHEHPICEDPIHSFPALSLAARSFHHRRSKPHSVLCWNCSAPTRRQNLPCNERRWLPVWVSVNHWQQLTKHYRYSEGWPSKQQRYINSSIRICSQLNYAVSHGVHYSVCAGMSCSPSP